MEALKAWSFGVQYSSDHANQSPHCHVEKPSQFTVLSSQKWLPVVFS